jgi:phosphoglucomutase
VRTKATTHLRDHVAKQNVCLVFETAMDFKFIGGLINADQFIHGGEVSVGLTINNNVILKQGGLLTVE